MDSRPCNFSGRYLLDSDLEYSVSFKGDMCGICGVRNGAETCLCLTALFFSCNLSFQKYLLFVCLL